jgi:diadenylate cyclase
LIWPINIQWIDVVDILLVALLIYYLYQLVKGTAAINIFFGILTIYILYLLVDALQMKLLSKILGQFIGVGVLALVVVFQQEIRRFLLLVGASWLNNRFGFLKRLVPTRLVGTYIQETDTKELELALDDLLRTQTGALIVILKNSELKYYLRSGIPMDAKLSSQLLQNIFFKNSPLHDGAVIIQGNSIKAARCILPLSEKTDFPDSFGLRHRAAVGVTELSDAVAIVISEQFQQISIVFGGKLENNITSKEAIRKLNEYLKKD